MKKLIFGLIAVILLTACSSRPAPTPQLAPDIATLPPSPTEALSPELKAESAAPEPTAEPAPEAPPSVSTFPDAAEVQWEVVANGLDQPLDIQHAGDNSGRIFIVERGGKILVLENGFVLEEPFLNIGNKIATRNSEQGLLGLAFHPDYAENGYFFINYSDRNGDTVIARYQVSGNPNQANPDSETAFIHVDQPFGNHNGGGMAFGPDGFLYIGLGDGGSANDPRGNGQNLNTYLGKLLRISVDSTEPPYGVPADNPFNDIQRSEIWALGLRNPWRFSFDSLTGDLYIGDVGQNQWEEIDFLPAGSPGGANFGWNYREGQHPFSGEPPAGTELIAPVAEYDHGQGCSVTGGVIYRGTELPEWQGLYLYGDFCSGRIWGLLQIDGIWQTQKLMEADFSIASFGQDQAGNIYLTDYSTESLYRLVRK
ncbi:MAG: PQQ-dependent sugar dehydrogenase [Anaerolineales bacterium]|uniref:PQQ-dependent sugar dehydrogenase n=1 Tax=Candidatus Desulfolinea nitratireducens TaxID=2841698 RepID=A0A8J6NH87_9CHLR|nr:PQQ-dependent sugar dehydrogenase [Candidatus Desulfolinea nitratireducens]MBL6960854.1 PQQ-dependent sugar dehydrogenase [Anaerolineales bacterium]